MEYLMTYVIFCNNCYKCFLENMGTQFIKKNRTINPVFFYKYFSKVIQLRSSYNLLQAICLRHLAIFL